MSDSDQYPGYCPAHAQAAGQYGWEFIPYRFLGCADCAKPEGFDPKNWPHLLPAPPRK